MTPRPQDGPFDAKWSVRYSAVPNFAAGCDHVNFSKFVPTFTLIWSVMQFAGTKLLPCWKLRTYTSASSFLPLEVQLEFTDSF